MASIKTEYIADEPHELNFGVLPAIETEEYEERNISSMKRQREEINFGSTVEFTVAQQGDSINSEKDDSFGTSKKATRSFVKPNLHSSAVRVPRILSRKTKKVEIKFNCTLCPNSFDDRILLNVHVEECHFDELRLIQYNENRRLEPKAYADFQSCFVCGFNVSHLFVHVRQCHPECVRCLYCRCPTWFLSLSDYNHHVDNMHRPKAVLLEEPPRFDRSSPSPVLDEVSGAKRMKTYNKHSHEG